jgi:fatty acid desaturase
MNHNFWFKHCHLVGPKPLVKALASTCRSYGWFLDQVFHHIADTHVAHHLFSYMPHYHAVEATAAIRKVLGGCQ